ncbi:MAG: alanine--tRNA ligase [Defluviitaleaceae bacterium]|nr:alanine--tRNA ligase [Defluviitaleaceae bacterium]
MKYQTVNQIRDAFLDFFVGKEHFVLPSYPLVPQGDKSLLLINSGMAPMKAFFTGQEKPPSPRVATCQKCIRTIDIDEVGRDARHASFFEMLGNFSFGDYFKKEVIPWSWEFLTKVMEIPAEKLSVSVYLEDDEAYAIWRDDVGVPESKIFRMGKEDNYWEHGNGPCGPCSEIYFDRGAKHGCGEADCTTGCECDRFMEVWNLVFTQFERREDGSYVPLEFTNIDTGMGLERLAIVMQDAASIFDIDNIKSVRDSILRQAHGGNRGDVSAAAHALEAENCDDALVSANIIADHVRSVTFMAADGVLPSNEGRGYVFRRLLRRAVRHGKGLGLTRFVQNVAQTAIDAYSHAYPNLSEKSGHILKTLGAEENRFLETLDTGMNLLQKQIDDLKAGGGKILRGADVFKLYDTFGFPPDLTREILEDNDLDWDEEGFKAEMQAQKTRAREARATFTYMGADETVYHKLPPNLVTEFVGYDADSCEAEVLAIIADGEIVDEAWEGQEVAVVLNKTPFYAASGGQKGDVGTFFDSNKSVSVSIDDCVTVAGNNTVHIGRIDMGELKVGQKITAAYTFHTRRATECNHTATHLLQKALRKILGDHVEQAGSSVDFERLRFDFTHMQSLTAEERETVEEIVCDCILAAMPVATEETSPDEARKKGAVALFGEKYGDTVRMVSIGNENDGPVSVELCGGTHVKNTSEIGLFRILSETGISSGVRRIEAETSHGARLGYKEEIRLQSEKIKSLSEENRALKKELAKIQSAAAGASHEAALADILKSAETVGNFTLISAKLENCDIEALRKICDKIKAEIKSGVLLLCGTNPETGAVQFLASASDDAVKAGINCGALVKSAAQTCGGGGGGKPNHAQAGGKDASKAAEAVAQAEAQMKEMLGA